MSRSRKKAIFKDKGIGRKAYHRIVRRHNGTILRTKIKSNILLDDIEIELDLKNSKSESMNMEELKSKIYLSIAEVCLLVGMSDSTIRKFVKEGKLKTIRLGKKHLILKSQIENLMC